MACALPQRVMSGFAKQAVIAGITPGHVMAVTAPDGIIPIAAL